MYVHVCGCVCLSVSPQTAPVCQQGIPAHLRPATGHKPTGIARATACHAQPEEGQQPSAAAISTKGERRRYAHRHTYILTCMPHTPSILASHPFPFLVAVSDKNKVSPSNSNKPPLIGFITGANPTTMPASGGGAGKSLLYGAAYLSSGPTAKVQVSVSLGSDKTVTCMTVTWVLISLECVVVFIHACKRTFVTVHRLHL